MLAVLDVLLRTTEFFRKKGIDSPRLDAELLMAHVLGLDRVQLYVQFEKPLTAGELEPLRELVRRRGEREPLAWLTGSKGFHAIDLAVRPGVLVPRPDTETLVDAALALLAPDQEAFVADIGCGSGCIGLAIAHARPGVKLFATDLSRDALACTRDNAAALGLKERVAVLGGDLLEPIPANRTLDLVVSNPPYIASAELAGLQPEVRDHEPRLALDGGQDGLEVYRRLVPMALERARRAVLVEIGPTQAGAVGDLFRASGAEPVVKKDLAGRDRVVMAVR